MNVLQRKGKCTYCSLSPPHPLPSKIMPKRQCRLAAKPSCQQRAEYKVHMTIPLKNTISIPWEVRMFVFILKWDGKLKYEKKKKVFEEENVARIRMFLTFSIKTKLLPWKCQIRKHNASFQNVDISDISKCRHFRDFSTLPKVEMSKCQFKIKHFILNFPIRKLENFIQFWHFPIKRCKNVDFSGNPAFRWENISVEEFQPALKSSGTDLESSSADCRHCSLLQMGSWNVYSGDRRHFHVNRCFDKGKKSLIIPFSPHDLIPSVMRYWKYAIILKAGLQTWNKRPFQEVIINVSKERGQILASSLLESPAGQQHAGEGLLVLSSGFSSPWPLVDAEELGVRGQRSCTCRMWRAESETKQGLVAKAQTWSLQCPSSTN